MESTATRLWQMSRGERKRNGRNRVAVGNIGWMVTQGCAFRATLGFGT